MSIRINAFSIAMAVICMSILVMLLLEYRRIRRGRLNTKVLFFVICVSSLRALFAVELPRSHVVPIKHLYNLPVDLINNGYLFGYPIKNVLLALWGIVSFVGIIYVLLLRIFIIRKVKAVSIDVTSKYSFMLSEIAETYGKKICVRILEMEDIDVPMCIGVKGKYIVIPRAIPDETLYYSIFHEYVHACNNDILSMTVIDIWVAIFWWNPFSYLLRYQMEESFELNCDKCITRNMNTAEKRKYLQTIVDVIKSSAERMQRYKATSMGLVRFNREKFVLCRFNNVINDSDYHRAKDVLLIISSVCIVALSYVFIFQAEFSLEDNQENGYEINLETMYIVQENDGVLLYEGDNMLGEWDSLESLEQFLDYGVPVIEGREK